MRKKRYAKTPTVYQMEATECGAASLCMILGYYGCHVPLEQMRIEAGVTRDGCNARNILRAARKYGLECGGYSCGLMQLIKLEPPCIIHWNFNHFVVFEGMKGIYAYINDPGMGRRRLSILELSECFTGIVLTFEKTDKLQKTRRESTLRGFIHRRLTREKGTLAALLCLSLLLLFSGVLTPMLSQIFVDNVLVKHNSGWAYPLLVITFLILLYNAFFQFLRGKVLQNLQSKLEVITGYKTLHHLLRLPIPFFEQRYAGDIASRIAGNDTINSFLAGNLTEVVLNLMLSLFYFLLMLSYQPLLTAIAIVGALFAMLLQAVCGASLATLSTKMQQDSGKMMGTLYAGISITDTLKAAGAENAYLSRILGYSARSATSEQQIGAKAQILTLIPQVLQQIVNMAILMLGGMYVIKGDMSQGELMAFLTLQTSFMAPIVALLALFQQTQTLKAEACRVQDLEAYAESESFHVENVEDHREKLIGYVELKEVSFGYNPMQPPMLQNISFRLEPGHSIALVGASGCGKSSVSKLVSGLNLPWSGEILLDGIPMNKLSPECIHASVAVVSQSLNFFSGTIRENLTLWNRFAMESDILNAAKDACIHDVILSLPGEYSYRLTEGATNLSGGQRQRLEIARALATNPSILILDEATSALDPVVEKEVLNNIRRRGCTCIVVAHRMSAIRDCDEILVMEKGQIVERGTHEELITSGGQYKTLMQNN